MIISLSTREVSHLKTAVLYVPQDNHSPAIFVVQNQATQSLVFSVPLAYFASLQCCVAFLAPVLVEKFSYSGKITEAESVCSNIATQQGEIYATKNQYTQVKKSNQSSLTSKLGVRKIDLKYYDYTIATTNKNFTITAEPKIKFLKNRAVPPKIYTFSHVLNGGDTKKWSNL